MFFGFMLLDFSQRPSERQSPQANGRHPEAGCESRKQRPGFFGKDRAWLLLDFEKTAQGLAGARAENQQISAGRECLSRLPGCKIGGH